MADIITYYIVCLSFPDPQAKISWASQVEEMHILAEWNMIGRGLFVSEPIGNLFYLYGVIFEIPN